MASNNISISGLLTNMLNMGFTYLDALQELLDNCLDAGSLSIYVRFVDTPDAPTSIVISDAGRGMNCDGLKAAACISLTKPPSESIGLRGYGLKAGHCVLSNEESVTRVLSKTVEDPTFNELCADWPSAIRGNQWNPEPRKGGEASAKSERLWNAYKVDASHGTVAVIPMTPDKYRAMVEGRTQLLKDIGRTYERQLRNGARIVVEVDGVQYTPDMSHALNWEDAEHKTEVPIEVWEHSETREIRVYYDHEGSMVRTNTDPKKRKPITDYAKAGEDGFVFIGSFRMRSAYTSAWNLPQSGEGARPALVPGYIAFVRGGRCLCPIPMEYPNKGDTEERRFVAASRHAVLFEHAADKLVGVQINKSNITPENICPELFAVIKQLAVKWAASNYRKPTNADAPKLDKALEKHWTKLKKTIKLRMAVYGNDFLDDLEKVIEDWDGVDEDDESSADSGAGGGGADGGGSA